MHHYVTESGIELMIPTSWEEMTLKQFVGITELSITGSASELIAVISGRPVEETRMITVDDADMIMSVLDFITDPFDYKKYPAPKVITIDGKEVDLTDVKIGKHSIWQRDMWQRECHDAKNDSIHVSKAAMGIAIYLQPIIEGREFDNERLPAIVKMIEQLPFVIAYPTANFFLVKFKQSLIKSLSGFKVTNPMPRRS